jgi:hypothetical protein
MRQLLRVSGDSRAPNCKLKAAGRQVSLNAFINDSMMTFLRVLIDYLMALIKDQHLFCEEL